VKRWRRRQTKTKKCRAAKVHARRSSSRAKRRKRAAHAKSRSTCTCGAATTPTQRQRPTLRRSHHWGTFARLHGRICHTFTIESLTGFSRSDRNGPGPRIVCSSGRQSTLLSLGVALQYQSEPCTTRSEHHIEFPTRIASPARSQLRAHCLILAFRVHRGEGTAHSGKRRPLRTHSVTSRFRSVPWLGLAASRAA